MNYHRNTLKGGPALHFYPIPTAEWKGAWFLCFVFLFLFFCRMWEWRRRPPHLPHAVHMAAIQSPPLRFGNLWTGRAALSEAQHEHWVTSNSHPVLPPSLLINLFNSDNLHTAVLQCGLGCPRDWFETHKSISESLRWGHSGADSIFGYAHLNPEVLQGNKTLQFYCGAGEQNKGTCLGS